MRRLGLKFTSKKCSIRVFHAEVSGSRRETFSMCGGEELNLSVSVFLLNFFFSADRVHFRIYLLKHEFDAWIIEFRCIQTVQYVI